MGRGHSPGLEHAWRPGGLGRLRIRGPADAVPSAGAAASAVAAGQGDLRVTTGLSVGWGDTYPAGIAFQWIDITGLKAGRYRLRAIADPANWFAETNNANNSTWVNIRLTNSGVSVLAYGPVA